MSFSQTANVGTSVNIPDLQTAIMLGEINPVNGEILEDINVTGNFDINGAFTFRDSDISINSILGAIYVLAESTFQNCHVDGVFGSQLWLQDETDYTGGEISVYTLAITSPDNYSFNGVTFALKDGIIPGNANTVTTFEGCYFYDQSYIISSSPSEVNVINCYFFGDDANIRQDGNQSDLTVRGCEFNGLYGITIQDGFLTCENNSFNGTEIGIRCYLIPQDLQQSASWIFIRNNNFNNCSQSGIHYVRGERLVVVNNRFDNCAIGIESNPFLVDNQFVVIGLNEFKNGGTGVYSDNVNNLRIINNDFIDLSPVNNHRGVIHLEEVVGGTVRLNEITRGTYGINLSNCDGTNISENIFDEVSGNSLAGVINLDDESENLLIDDNEILNSDPPFGIWSFSASNCTITNNVIYGGAQNMRFTTSNGHTVEGNEMYNGSKGLLCNASSNMTFSCNRMENATEGAFFRGNNMLLHFSVNRMEVNDIGLYYSASAQSDPQLQQSNTWYNNTIEGARNDNENLDHVEDSRYEVPDESVYPSATGLTPSSWTPAIWFEELKEGVFIADCLIPPAEDDDQDGDGMLTPEHDEIVALENSIDSINITQGDGYWMMNQMVAKSILDDHPEYLNQSSILSNFYNAYSIELPLMSDIFKSLPAQSFVDDVPVVEFDQNGEVINLANFQNYTDGELTAFTQYSALRHQELANQLSAVQTANTYNAMQQHYQYMMELYLEQLVNDYQLNAQEIQDITALAEGCVGTDGPAVYVARKLAVRNGINITENFDCLDLSRGSLKQDNLLTNQVFPNPNMGTVNFLNKENLKTIVLFDAFGRKVKKLNTENQTLVQFSIDELNAGVYYLKSPESIRTHRIVLQK